MFNFRIIDTPDGNQIIDRNLKTPYKALTPLQMVEYLEMDNRLKMLSICLMVSSYSNDERFSIPLIDCPI